MRVDPKTEYADMTLKLSKPKKKQQVRTSREKNENTF